MEKSLGRSNAITDSDGNYQLQTRHGNIGALIGNHEVIFEYPDLADTESLKAELREAKAAKEDTTQLKAALDEMKQQLKELPKIPSSANRKIAVPSGGITPCDFELISD